MIRISNNWYACNDTHADQNVILTDVELVDKEDIRIRLLALIGFTALRKIIEFRFIIYVKIIPFISRQVLIN